MDKYEKFILSRRRVVSGTGFSIDLDSLNEKLMDWQKRIVQWAVRRGRAALFEDCGMGKTFQQLEWARVVHNETNMPVVIHCPVGVRQQTKREAEKFGIKCDVAVCDDPSELVDGINLINYEKLHKFDGVKFGGVVLDESSILKGMNGKTRDLLCERYKETRFRLACTATPAPNDHMELGNHAIINDMGNCESDEEFFQHFGFLIEQLYRVIKPGRLCSVHCMNMPSTITHDGYIGIRDFRGDIIRAFQEYGFIYHSEVCIWKDPVTAMQRTKALGLLHKQVCKDSSMSRQGIPDYVCTFRKPGKNPDPIAGEFDHFAGEESGFQHSGVNEYNRLLKQYEHYLSLTTDDERLEHRDSGGQCEKPCITDYTSKSGSNLSIDIWQRYASPVWMDIDQSNTLNARAARHESDTRHICPLQLDVIHRCLQLWSKEGDIVLSPFAGIGSEGYESIKLDRKFIGIELKESYFEEAAKNLRRIEKEKAKSNLF